MKFTKEQLVDIHDQGQYFNEEIVDQSRWATTRTFLFNFEDKTYCASYTRGSTEQQDHSPWEYDFDSEGCQECPEMVEKQIVTTRWVPANDH